MNVRHYLPGILLSCSLFVVCSCDHKPKSEAVKFTKLDSLTDEYLDLKDRMLETWNAMINDDNQKLEAMSNLLHELVVSNPQNREALKTFGDRLIQLRNSRYTQKTMANTHVVEEYDFASNSLVNELVSMAESQRQYSYNTTLQKLVETIRSAEQRVENYRLEYDTIAEEYNRFIDSNRTALKEIDEDTFLEKKPLFQVAEQ
jgi:septal ring factor EnvC (AmiA/AmiB activator)